MRQHRLLRHALTASGVAILSACGGGGGGDSGMTPIGADTTASTIALTAPANLAAGLTGSITISATAGDNVAPLFTCKHVDAAPAGSGSGGFFKGAAIACGAFYPAAGTFPADDRGQCYFADVVNRFVGRLDAANGNAAHAFASLTGSPVDLRAAGDGALLVLTRNGVTRITAP